MIPPVDNDDGERRETKRKTIGDATMPDREKHDVVVASVGIVVPRQPCKFSRELERSIKNLFELLFYFDDAKLFHYTILNFKEIVSELFNIRLFQYFTCNQFLYLISVSYIFIM